MPLLQSSFPRELPEGVGMSTGGTILTEEREASKTLTTSRKRRRDTRDKEDDSAFLASLSEHNKERIEQQNGISEWKKEKYSEMSAMKRETLAIKAEDLGVRKSELELKREVAQSEERAVDMSENDATRLFTEET